MPARLLVQTCGDRYHTAFQGSTRPMCNSFRNRVPVDAIGEAFSEVGLVLRFPGGVPNLEPRPEIRISEAAPIIRRDGDRRPELVQLRWSWPAPNGKPVYNLRSDGRGFGSGRCLIPTDGFYEFTDPDFPAPKRARKTRWVFTLKGEPWFCIAGVWRPSPLGDAFSLLTTPPGPDVAPYHDRQVVVLGREQWAAWLDPARPSAGLLRSLPAGSLGVERAPWALSAAEAGSLPVGGSRSGGKA